MAAPWPLVLLASIRTSYIEVDLILEIRSFPTHATSSILLSFLGVIMAEVEINGVH